MSVVMKFGGTSVADPAAIDRLIGIVRRQRESEPANSPAPVVVVSALSGVTDALIAVTRQAEDGDAAGAAAALQVLRERHVTVASAVTNASQSAVLADLGHEFDELVGLVHALAVLRDVSPRSLDAVVAVGELVSSRIVAAALADCGVASGWVDARRALVTDAEHAGAAPDMIETCERTRAEIAPLTQASTVAVLGGFIGSTANGVTTTLGRGGSDYSAAIFGACLGVDEIQIWTDVDGMLTADPRVVAQPRVVPQLSFAEASELAYFGAKVLHPSTILPAVARNIPVRILNARRPESLGTLITAEAQADARLAAIACKRNVTVIDITSTRMLMAHGFLRRVFEAFETNETAVDVVTTSEVSVSVTIDDNRRGPEIVAALLEFADVTVEEQMAILTVVGERLATNSTLAARIVGAMTGFPLRMISQAASRRNLTIVLPEASLAPAMMHLHRELFAIAEPAR